MKCPRCVQLAGPGVESCPHCGYSLQTACALYGGGAVVAERLMDVEGYLDPAQQEAILDSIGRFDRCFPQLFLLMYLGPLPAPASPRQFAFWLLNHAAIPDPVALQPNEHGLLLVVDPWSGTAVLAGGYFIEYLLRQEELDAVLKGAGKSFAGADYPAAVQAITEGLTGLLQRRAREVAKNPDKFQPPRSKPRPVPFPPLIRTGEVSLPESQELPHGEPEREKKSETDWETGTERLRAPDPAADPAALATLGPTSAARRDFLRRR